MKFSIGERKKPKKTITINFKPIHLWFGAIVFVVAVLVHSFIWSPYIYTYVVCPNESIQVIDSDTNNVCGVIVPQDMSDKKKVQYYNDLLDMGLGNPQIAKENIKGIITYTDEATGITTETIVDAVNGDIISERSWK